ncbi:hypothetical protein C8T65DRAFT_668919 [Cerioporus squamosus]|nr:hypothetical protein C8T65DRAFT_668919 [Cerioporus squamosus]
MRKGHAQCPDVLVLWVGISTRRWHSLCNAKDYLPSCLLVDCSSLPLSTAYVAMNQPLTTHAFASPPNVPADFVKAYLRVLLDDELLVQMMYQQLALELLSRAAMLAPRLPTPGYVHPGSPVATRVSHGLSFDALLSLSSNAEPLASRLQPQDVAEPLDALIAGMANVAIAPEIFALETPLDWVALLQEAFAAVNLSEGPSPEVWDWPDSELLRGCLNDGLSDPVTQLGIADLLSCGAPSPGHGVQLLEQGTYHATQPIKGLSAGPMLFNRGTGVPLSAIGTLSNGDMPAFDCAASIGVKSSMRFELSGLTDHSTQVRVRCGKAGEPVTLRRMAELVREQFGKLMNHAESVGKPLRYRGRVVPFEKIVLLRIEHVSKGSIQPILGIWDDGRAENGVT